jgi:hypothetical protein
MLTLEEIQTLMAVLDAGIKAVGVQIFQNEGGVKLQSVLTKLQAAADEISKEKTDGETQL